MCIVFDANKISLLACCTLSQAKLSSNSLESKTFYERTQCICREGCIVGPQRVNLNIFTFFLCVKLFPLWQTHNRSLHVMTDYLWFDTVFEFIWDSSVFFLFWKQAVLGFAGFVAGLACWIKQRNLILCFSFIYLRLHMSEFLYRVRIVHIILPVIAHKHLVGVFL